MSIHRLSSDTMLLGLQRIGVIGLREAIEKVRAEGLADREAILDRLTGILKIRNHIPEGGDDRYRVALWREWLRLHGGDLREYYSEVPVTVLGDAGDERDRFVEILTDVLGELELRPVVAFGAANGRSPALVIAGETVVRGLVNRSRLRAAIHRSISDW